MGTEISRPRYVETNQFRPGQLALPDPSWDFPGTTGPREGAQQDEKPPKLKIFESDGGNGSRKYYFRKEHFSRGSFGRTYAALDSRGYPCAIKEVKLKPSTNPRKNGPCAAWTRAVGTPQGFEEELKRMMECNNAALLWQGPNYWFTNKKESRGYAVMTLMNGNGSDLMGCSRGGTYKEGALDVAFDRALTLSSSKRAAKRHPVLRDVLAKLAKCGARLHKQNIILCDIKPENILYLQTVDRDQNVVSVAEFSDFGMAVRGEGAGFPGGTKIYLAPETGERVFKSTDVYALGVTLLEWLLQEHPFCLNGARLKPADYANYLAGRSSEHDAYFRAMWNRAQQIDPALCELARKMIGPPEGRPTMQQVQDSPAVQLSNKESALVDQAWKNLPRYSEKVRRQLCKVETEVQTHRFTYRRLPAVWGET
jgi:serine/threonine protein kinase